jgi:predicted nucleic acid-binding protein
MKASTMVQTDDTCGRSVLADPKFDPYPTIGERRAFLRPFDRIAERIPIIHIGRACRDPNDDKSLELGVHGEAHLIIAGGSGLLAFIRSARSIFSRRQAISPGDAGARK